MNDLLDEERVEQIRNALKGQKSAFCISYEDKWSFKSVKKHSADLVVTQAVMEHVENPGFVYNSISNWLKKGGFASHVIGLDSHGLSDYWNGHLGFPPRTFALIKGKRNFLINRLPFSEHMKLIEKSGLELVLQKAYRRKPSGLKKFRVPCSKTDLTVSEAYFIAQKKV